MDVHVFDAPWDRHEEQLKKLRERVFIEEQGVPRDLEMDGLDAAAWHVLALNAAGQPVGCGRLLPSGQIGRMAVLAELRGSGLGRRLLDTLVERAKALGLQRVFLHAQKRAVPFYRRAGFLPEGEEFLEAGIPHLAMALELPIPFESPGATPLPVNSSPASESERPEPVRALRTLEGEMACQSGLVEGLAEARRQVRIFSPLLDPVLFDQPLVAEGLSEFARRGPPVQARILIVSSSAMVARGHRLLELARRLDSKIEIRRVAEEQAGEDVSFFCWDGTGFWLMPDYREYQCLLNLNDPVRSAQLADKFDQLWARSQPDPELRELKL